VGESGKKLGVYPFEFTENLDSKNKNAGREWKECFEWSHSTVRKSQSHLLARY
jgi:hypothetical protein